jgi:hypothetical protein
MTLHSVSLIYPEVPSPEERAIASKFLDLFARTITCIFCKNHFASMYAIYKNEHPEYLNSRQDFALFAFRAHNTVNKRLDKPRPSSMADCLATLLSNTANTTFAQFRRSYLDYLIRNWGQDFGVEGRMLQRDVAEMNKINNEYWSPRELTSIPELAESDVMTPIEKAGFRVVHGGQVISTRVGFIGGRLKLGRK